MIGSSPQRAGGGSAVRRPLRSSTELGPETSRARDPDRSGIVSRDGIRIFYEVYGEGPRTVLLHPPWASTPARAWKAQIPYLARHFRVIAADPRGNGRSGRPTGPAAHLPAERAADSLAVLDATETRRAVAVTAGPGAVPALMLASQDPERVEGLVLITPDPWPEQRYVSSFTKGELDHYEGWDRFNPAYWREDWRGFVEWWAGSKLGAEPHSTRQVEDGIDWMIETGPEVFTAAVVALAAADRDAVLALARAVRCPALVIYDDTRQIVASDTWTPLAEATGGRLLKIEGANHYGLGRYPVAFNLAIREFVESLDSISTTW